MGGFKLRTFNVKKTGDILEVKLSDSNYNPIVKEKVRVNNEKQMRELISKLKEKGVSFPQDYL